MPDSRRLVFLLEDDNDTMKEFHAQVTIMTNLKIYINQVCKERDRIDTQITAYLKQVSQSDTLVFKDNSLNAAYRIDPILSKLRRSENLQRLTFSNCGIGDDYFSKVLDCL